MINSYPALEAEIEQVAKIRSRNYANTNCDISALVGMVYREIAIEVPLSWKRQSFVLTKDTYEYQLVNSLALDDNTNSDVIDYYGAITDIVDQQLNDVSIHFNQPEEGLITVDDAYLCQHLDETIFIMRRNFQHVKTLSPRIYNLIFKALMEGVIYYIEDSIPSQKDGQLANLHYQRYFNERKMLKALVPEINTYDGSQAGSKPKLGEL